MADLNMQQLAESYGWNLTLLKSDPSLEALFKRAVEGNFTADRFTAELRSTNWYKKHSEPARQMAVLQTADPATYAQRIQGSAAQVLDMARQIGATVSGNQANLIAQHALTLGWNDAQIKQHLLHFVKANSEGGYAGQTAANYQELEQYAYDMGIKVSNGALQRWAIQGNQMGIEGVKQHLQQQAMGRYPALAEQIKGGQTVAQLADPYMQSISQVLERSSTSMYDPLVQKALMGKDAAGKPTTVPLWQFEEQLRSTNEWRKTQNAQDSLMQIGHQVLQDFGLKS